MAYIQFEGNAGEQPSRDQSKWSEREVGKKTQVVRLKEYSQSSEPRPLLHYLETGSIFLDASDKAQTSSQLTDSSESTQPAATSALEEGNRLSLLIEDAWEHSVLELPDAFGSAIPSEVLQSSFQNTVHSSSLIGRIFPNGEYSVGFVPPASKLKADRLYDEGVVGDYKQVVTGRAVVLDDDTVYFDPSLEPTGYLIKLDKCKESSQTKTYGQNGITGYGRKCVRNYCYLLERDYGASNLAFGTVTLPPLTAEQEIHLCKNWSHAVRVFFQRLKRKWHASCPDEAFRYVAVTEIQPKRWYSRREVGLHLHFLYRKLWNSSISSWAIEDNFVRLAWRGAVVSVLKSMPIEGDNPDLPIPMFRREHVGVGGIAKYLAKYMSKGGEVLDEVKSAKPDVLLPRQWWAVDEESRKRLKAEIIEVTGEDAEILVEFSRIPSCPMLEWASPVYIEVAGKEKLVGYCGVLNEDGLDVFRIPF